MKSLVCSVLLLHFRSTVKKGKFLIKEMRKRLNIDFNIQRRRLEKGKKQGGMVDGVGLEGVVPPKKEKSLVIHYQGKKKCYR